MQDHENQLFPLTFHIKLVQKTILVKVASFLIIYCPLTEFQMIRSQRCNSSSILPVLIVVLYIPCNVSVVERIEVIEKPDKD